MRVDFYGIYRPIVGGKSIEFDAAGGTVRTVLDALIARFPLLRDELLDERGNLLAAQPLFLNGRNPRLLPDGLQTCLQPADVLSIFSPVASGKINVEDIRKSAAG